MCEKCIAAMNEAEQNLIRTDPGCRVVIRRLGDVVLETCDRPIVARVDIQDETGVGLCKDHKRVYYQAMNAKPGERSM